MDCSSCSHSIACAALLSVQLLQQLLSFHCMCCTPFSAVAAAAALIPLHVLHPIAGTHFVTCIPTTHSRPTKSPDSKPGAVACCVPAVSHTLAARALWGPPPRGRAGPCRRQGQQCKGLTMPASAVPLNDKADTAGCKAYPRPPTALTEEAWRGGARPLPLRQRQQSTAARRNAPASSPQAAPAALAARRAAPAPAGSALQQG